MHTHIQAHGERVSFQGLIVIQCSSKGVYSTFLMHPFASGLHPQRGFCATLDSPVPGVPHTQACALRQKLISDLASPIFFWSTTHIHWHFRSVWETLLYLLCAFISIFHQGIIQSLPFFFGFFSKSQKVKMGKLIRINICKVLWKPQVIVSLLTDQNKTHIFWGWCHYCSASIFGGMVSLFFCFVPSWNILC